VPQVDLSKPKTIEQLRKPGWYSQIGQPNFGVRVTKTRAKSYYWIGRVKEPGARKTKPKWIPIGRVNALSFGDARTIALDIGSLKAKARHGQARFDSASVIPQEAVIEAVPLTVERMYSFYWDLHGSKTKRADNLRQLYERQCRILGPTMLVDLDSERVQDWHDGIKAPISALHAYQLLRAAARFCMRHPKKSGWPRGFANPFSGVVTQKAKKRKRRIEGLDLRSFGKAATRHPDPRARAFVLGLHVSGARVSELRLAAVAQFDPKRNCIVWPDSKNNDERVLTFGPITGRMIRGVIGERTHGLIWPGDCADGGFDFRKAWIATCNAAGIDGYSFHDARRSFAEVLANHAGGEFSDLRIEELLGHRLQGIAAHYRHLDRHSPIRAKAAAAVEVAMGVAPAKRAPATKRAA